MNKVYAITAAGMVVAMLGGMTGLVLFGDRANGSCSETSIAGGATIGGPFELVSETGETVTDADVITAPSLVYFGYTFCPDVCPLDAVRNAEAVDLLAAQGVDAKAVFITIDPERDTPEVLAEFTDVMHEDMIGLTGSPEQIKAASMAYRTFYRKQPGDPDYYLVDHSTFTYLVLPETGFVDFFRREATAEQMAETVSCFVAET